jgi:tellurite resistance protein TehA-like permease
MKGLTKALKIIAIVLNIILLAGLICFLIRLGAHPQTLSDWAGFISMFAFPPITLITIALTFYKKSRILTSVLRIIAVIVNASFLLILICVTAIGRVHLEGLAMWLLGLMGYGLPVLNVLALALTFRKGKEKIAEKLGTARLLMAGASAEKMVSGSPLTRGQV